MRFSRIVLLFLWGFLGIWGWAFTSAQTVSISGEDPGYAGKTLQVFVPGNPFLDMPLFTRTLVCDQHGAFHVELETTGGTLVRIVTSVYDASIYTEPGNEYNIQLPAYKEMAYTERISPFFEPMKVPLKVKGKPRM